MINDDEYEQNIAAMLAETSAVDDLLRKQLELETLQFFTTGCFIDSFDDGEEYEIPLFTAFDRATNTELHSSLKAELERIAPLRSGARVHRRREVARGLD